MRVTVHGYAFITSQRQPILSGLAQVSGGGVRLEMGMWYLHSHLVGLRLSYAFIVSELMTHSTNRQASLIVVVGSLNVDLISRVPALPKRGQTVSASTLIRQFGGKGANQALAAARQGARVHLIGCVGADDEGRAYRSYWSSQGLGLRGIHVLKTQPTGMAFITVEEGGENQIVVVPGANGKLSRAMVRAESGHIRAAAVLLAQLEVPLPTVLEALRIANTAQVRVVFNPSPSTHIFPWGSRRLDVVVANELEIRQILGVAPDRVRQRLASNRQRLIRQSIGSLVITRGASPTLLLTASTFMEIPVLKVRPVDTVGAGDAFAGTLAARLAEGNDLPSSVRAANCAGALATLKPGAQESIPSRAQTDRCLRKLPTP